jgi:hypothetical protein
MYSAWMRVHVVPGHGCRCLSGKRGGCRTATLLALPGCLIVPCLALYMQVLIERAGQLPHSDFEPRTLLNLLCPTAAMQCEVSQVGRGALCLLCHVLLPLHACVSTCLGGDPGESGHHRSSGPTQGQLVLQRERLFV